MLPIEFCDRMRALLGEEYPAYLAAMDEPAVRALHINTRKGDPERVREAVTRVLGGLSALPYASDGYLWCGDEHIGTTPLHHAGAIYVQEPSAMAPVCCLPDVSGRRVLDLCAAPGGKSTQLANRIGPEGLLVANEIHPGRCSILCGNLERMGLPNVWVTKAPADVLSRAFGAFFDVIVTDSPCSGEGMFRKDPDAVTEWTPDSPGLCAERSRDILAEAAEMLAPGGYLLYSTCTFAPCEDEETVAWFLARHPDFSLCDVPAAVCAVTRPGVPTPGLSAGDLAKCRRFYPHVAPGEGQFMALLQRQGTLPPPAGPSGIGEGTSAARDAFADRKKKAKGQPGGKPVAAAEEEKVIRAFLVQVLGEENAAALPPPCTAKGGWVIPPADPALLPERESFTYAFGVRVGEVRKGRVIPHHHFFTAFGSLMSRRLELSGEAELLQAYLSGEEIPADLPDGWGCVTLWGLPVGGIKVSGGMAKNHYPTGLRNKK